MGEVQAIRRRLATVAEASPVGDRLGSPGVSIDDVALSHGLA